MLLAADEVLDHEGVDFFSQISCEGPAEQTQSRGCENWV